MYRAVTHTPTSNALTRNSVDALCHAAVPEHDVSVLAPRHKHVAVMPRVHTHHVPHVTPGLGLHHLASAAVSQEDLVLAGASGDQCLSSWDPGAVPDGAIMDAQGAGVQIPILIPVTDSLTQPRHIGELDSFVVAARREYFSIRGPT